MPDSAKPAEMMTEAWTRALEQSCDDVEHLIRGYRDDDEVDLLGDVVDSAVGGHAGEDIVGVRVHGIQAAGEVAVAKMAQDDRGRRDRAWAGTDDGDDPGASSRAMLSDSARCSRASRTSTSPSARCRSGPERSRPRPGARSNIRRRRRPEHPGVLREHFGGEAEQASSRPMAARCSRRTEPMPLP